MKTDTSTRKAYHNIFSALVMLPIMGFFAYLSVNVTELFWRVTVIFFTLVSMMVYGGLLGCCRPIFKTGKLFGVFAVFAIVFPMAIFIVLYDKCIRMSSDVSLNFVEMIIIVILTSTIFCIPQFASFLYTYQRYVAQTSSFITNVKISFFRLLFIAVILISPLTLSGNMTHDWSSYIAFTYILFGIGIVFGDSFYDESIFKVLRILLIPSALLLITIFLNILLGGLKCEIKTKEIYFIFGLLLLLFLPQFLGYKIAARRRRAALVKHTQDNV